ncbi:MAG: NAD(P)/FAD-dependent oxidoreductase [Oribacterium sp.]
MIRINQLRLPVNTEETKIEELLRRKCAALLRVPETKPVRIEILRRSIDARHRPELFFSYTVSVSLPGRDEAALVRKLKNHDISCFIPVEYHIPTLPERIEGMPGKAYFSIEEHRPRIVGFGPAGMFAGLLLARAGLRPIILERGEAVEARVQRVEALWEQGTLHPDSNPQFGEGGAGTFSDGKLNTLVKDKDGRGRFVLREFVRHGAEEDILIDAKPHIGTDRLVEIVRSFREEILHLGGEIHFRTKYRYQGDESYPIVLAIGHSSRDSYEELYAAGLRMEAKDFAMGFRVQHPQRMIDRALYGDCDSETRRLLGAAAYKLTHTAKSGRGVYSFCMCPGGYVVNSSSEEGCLCVNGMSYSGRDSENANAAIIVSVRKTDYLGEKNPLNGIRLQRELETRAYQLGKGKIPIERYGDFRAAVLGEHMQVKNGMRSPKDAAECMRERGAGEPIEEPVRPLFRGAAAEADLTKLFCFEKGSPYVSLNDVNRSLVEGMEHFSHRIPGFSRADVILAGIEARTSSPVRIPRDENFRGSIRNIYPCGEGAGYAGGITSAAMDGMRVAEAIIRQYQS